MAAGTLHCAAVAPLSQCNSPFRAGDCDLWTHGSAKLHAGKRARSHAGLSAKARAGEVNSTAEEVSRRSVMGAGVAAAAAVLLQGESALAIQTSSGLAGRVPGLSEPDEDGLRTYKRPEGKSGGHGVGWSELIPYSFKVSDDWGEVPVSIADLGGTEIDLRFSSPKEGNISVVVAPVLRFSDTLGDNARIEDIGDPEKVIYAFGPELTGNTVEGRVREMEVKAVGGRTYYQYELDPHILVSATAAGNRLYIITVSASGRQWKKYGSSLREIAKSFRVG